MELLTENSNFKEKPSENIYKIRNSQTIRLPVLPTGLTCAKRICLCFLIRCTERNRF